VADERDPERLAWRVRDTSATAEAREKALFELVSLAKRGAELEATVGDWEDIAGGPFPRKRAPQAESPGEEELAKMLEAWLTYGKPAEVARWLRSQPWWPR